MNTHGAEPNIRCKIFRAHPQLIIVLLIMNSVLCRLATEAEDVAVDIRNLDDEVTKTTFSDFDDTDPAPDIWAWGLITDRYLPHVRSVILQHCVKVVNYMFDLGRDQDFI